MRGFFAFRFFEPNELDRNSLGIFCSSKTEIDRLIEVIKKDISEAFVPKSVYVMAMVSVKTELLELLENVIFKKEFESILGKTDEKLKPTLVCGEGVFVTSKGENIDDNLRNSIIQGGMHEIFKRRKGVISSSASYHFAKPSGDHCDKFIRASNLLISSAEVYFLALPLLPFITKSITRIYIDTSSIAYLVSTAIQLSSIANSSEVMIESFESYAALKEPYDFVEDRHSLVLISATTSGSMAKQLMSERGFGRDQILTLFHLGLPLGQTGLFNALPAVPGGITSVSAHECKLCKRGSKLIRISGDQFLPETPKHELLVVKKSDFDKERESFFREFAQRGVLQWNKDVDNSKEHLFIDAEEIINNVSGDFKRDLDRAKNRYLTRHTNTIITLDCKGSVKLGVYLASGSAGILVKNFSNLDSIDLSNTKSVLVVAGSITSGRKLLSVSRKLRELGEGCVISYFIGFSKLPTVEAETQLKRDLTLGGNEFFVLRKAPLPRVKDHDKTAWDFENDFMVGFSENDPFSESSEKLPAILSERMSAETTRCDNNLFLPSPAGSELTLRKTFAFWSDIDFSSISTSVTQSDVYWTIQAILHDLRIRSKDKGLASTYHTTLISPVCFDRYNDGVIQACFLRAAKPVELNYSIDEEFSRQMADVIYSVVSNWATDQGEASLEFLLALACGRLTLMDKHTHEVTKLFDESMPDEMQFLLKSIESE
jgi:hypothetical protein